MWIERMNAMVEGVEERGAEAAYHVVRWSADGRVEDVASAAREQGLAYLVFLDERFFPNSDAIWELCEAVRSELSVLWSARLNYMPDAETLRSMRLAGCQRLGVTMDGEPWDAALERAREFGFEVRMASRDGFVRENPAASYTVAEREAIACRLQGHHATQFDLAAALFRAGRHAEVMRPLGKAMTLGFPMNELCLNLLACLGAAKHYPDMAAGLLTQAGHGWPHPVVMRNRERLRSWAATGGDVRGVRLMLEPEAPSPL